MPWTRERLEFDVRERLNGVKLVVVANREPFIHSYSGMEIRCVRPASGLTTALDPVMRACGGTWIAHGSGDADHVVVDDRDRVQVPPGAPSYTLRRVWLTKEEEQGYYYGFSNEALWPLCHITFNQPHFRTEDWEQYRLVNHKFAAAVLDEVGSDSAIVFVQDYHFALLPRLLKNVRPDLVVAQFWHIPWPNREAFRVCPWQEEILDGLLGNDLLSFHIQHHCNNFLETVDRALESRVDLERFSVTLNGRITRVRPHPISIDPETIAVSMPKDMARAERDLRQRLNLRDERLLIGIDRVDYTKGIVERLRAVDQLLTSHPEWKRKVTFVQAGAPSRSQIPAYRQLHEHIETLVEEINLRHGEAPWQPAIYLQEHCDPATMATLARMASACIVSSLHDGMNLVAKEFVAARDDLAGVLVLSQFTGAARELLDALLINPYATDQFANALHAALTMPLEEQKRRMLHMRTQVSSHNVYRWAGTILSETAKLIEHAPMTDAALNNV